MARPGAQCRLMSPSRRYATETPPALMFRYSRPQNRNAPREEDTAWNDRAAADGGGVHGADRVGPGKYAQSVSDRTQEDLADDVASSWGCRRRSCGANRQAPLLRECHNPLLRGCNVNDFFRLLDRKNTFPPELADTLNVEQAWRLGWRFHHVLSCFNPDRASRLVRR